MNDKCFVLYPDYNHEIELPNQRLSILGKTRFVLSSRDWVQPAHHSVSGPRTRSQTQAQQKQEEEEDEKDEEEECHTQS